MEQHRCMGCMTMTENAVCEKCGWSADRTNEPHQLPVGYVLRGQYIVGRVLGQGGFGITYLGWDSYLELPVAIKEFYPNSMVNRECSMTTKVHCYTEQVAPQYVMSKERFLREAKALAKFEDEPAIVRIRNFFEENETAYIVMEYVRGTTLAAYVNMRGGRLTPEETLRILKPVMEALAVVHEAELVHRDISPDNIMLHPRGGAKLLDFGAVRSVENAEAGKDMARSTEAILKHGFAPMEQYQSRGGLGPWTDEYALCATIYYCLTGKIPVEAPVRMLEEIEIDWDIPGLTERQKRALDKGMAVRARDRHSSVRELLVELYSAEPEPVPQPVPRPEPAPQPVPKPKPEKVSKPKQRRKTGKGSGLLKWAVLGGAAVLVIAVILLLPRGWRIESGDYYYYSGGRMLQDSWYQEEGRFYYFGSDGAMVTSWQLLNGQRYYFGGDGVMVRGWISEDGGRYYLGEDGIMVTGLRQIGEDTYLFDENGVSLTGWQKLDGKNYYFTEEGAMATGWLTISGTKYHFSEDGTMDTGRKTIDDHVYYFTADGKMTTGWQSISGIEYYFGSDGKMVTGWQTINGNRYYFKSDGKMTTGKKAIDGYMYYFSDDGKMTTGWKVINGCKYYFNSNGAMATGWQIISGKKYYFSINGIMSTGWKTIDDYKYYFEPNGTMVTGGRTINGRWYSFDNQGRLQ